MNDRSSVFEVSVANAVAALDRVGAHFTTLFEHGTLALEIYRPGPHDPQQPHDRDELYVVISGSGWFERAGTRVAFGPGDVLFVAAHLPHRFVDYSPEFLTWVVFYGPVGGEKS
jgi:mannose-6-phosphate isomerase-like protein (cupin superfamily)